MDFLKESLATVTSLSIMTSLVACAYASDAMQYITLPAQPSNPASLRVDDIPSDVKISVSEYAELYGFGSEQHEIVTGDGFLLNVDRVFSKSSLGAVLMMHGLFQSSGVFVTSGVDSLAFVLANQGYDVWLGNNRCVEKKHVTLKDTDEKFWDWSMDELARFDFPALIDFVLQETNTQKLIYVGHSQGTSQAFLGLSFNPLISEKIKCLAMLAPAMYVGPLLHTNPLSYIIQASDSSFLALFGTKEFVPLMTTVRHLAPSAMFTDVAYRMFHFLFNWTDAEWNKAHKTAYFHTTPRPTSTKGLLHWFQIARYGNVLRPFRCSSPSVSRADSGIESTPGIFTNTSFDLSCIRCPVAVMYGGKDKIVDARRMVKECGLDGRINLLLAECVEGYEHMDVLWGKHAKTLVFDKLVKTFEEL